ncbi:uncharacterized protein C4orf22 homolog [Cimex lectularius]|uniref:Cilia- and flagella-associated protein 299 n=1 Tax=Cimex lectularius TaxID=79782 RepID=A0A8I6R7Z2_CIMLE|nr:uncharacterized protein C4orf22 homolog [Cimex lectularius]
MLRRGDEDSDELECDRIHILKFKNYDEYLDDLISENDLFYLRSRMLTREIARLGYRSSGDTLSESEFKRRREKVKSLMTPIKIIQTCISTKLSLGSDQLIEELAVRERANRSAVLLSIIYIRVSNKRGTEVAGFIDYNSRLVHSDMTGFFLGKKKLWPMQTDLGFFNCKNKTSRTNHTDQIESLVDPVKGLLFKHKWDNLIIDPNPRVEHPGVCTCRTVVKSPSYHQCVIFDHVIRTMN